MADINYLVGKWTIVNADGDLPLEAEEKTIEFYKDGSCLVHVKLLGGNSEVSPLFFFYKAFENHTIKFDSGEPGTNLFRFSLEGDKLYIRTLLGKEFIFVKEDKRAKNKAKAVEAPKAQKAKEEDIDRDPGENEWKCPKCGKIHQKYVGTCGCGEPKPKEAGPYIPPQEVLDKIKAENEKPVAVEEAEEEAVAAPEEIPVVEVGENEWQCPKCGKVHQKYVGTCGCGEPKPKEAGPYIPPQEVLDKIKAEMEKASAPAEVEEEAAAAPEKPAEPEIEPGENEWKCPKCGKIHQKYVGTCGCGEPKPKEAGPYIPPQEVLDKIKAELEKASAPAEEPEEEAEAPKKVDKNAKPERVPTENEWKCPKCGKINQNYVGTCGCGEGKPKPAPAVE